MTRIDNYKDISVVICLRITLLPDKCCPKRITEIVAVCFVQASSREEARKGYYLNISVSQKQKSHKQHKIL